MQNQSATAKETSSHFIVRVESQDYRIENPSEMLICSETGCTNFFVGFLGSMRLCSPHFLARCYNELNTLGMQISKTYPSGSTRGQMRSRLGALADQTFALTLSSKSLDRFQQLQVLDILERTSILLGRLRRSERLPVKINVQVSTEKLRAHWFEHTQTRTVSRYGASIEFHYPVQRGDIVTLQHASMDRSVRARVVWKATESRTSALCGVELISPKNIWGIVL